MKKESWKTEKAKLRETFAEVLGRIWERWNEFEMEGSPFGKLQELVQSGMSDVEIQEMYFDVGWTRGVSESLGWSLDRPGPREWSPRDR